MTSIPVFPSFPGITYPVKRTPEVATTRISLHSGRRYAEPKWPYPIYHYEVDISVLRSSAAYSEFQTFLGFWNQVMTTPGQLFIWIDPDDGSVTNQYLGTGDGVTTSWQALRSLGGFVEPVTAVLPNPDVVTGIEDDGNVTDSVTQTIDDGTVTGSVTATFDYGGITLTHFYVNGVEVDVTIFNGGALQFTVAPPNGASITWTGTYGWLCQFDNDTADLENFMYQLYSLQTLSFTTARPTV